MVLKGLYRCKGATKSGYSQYFYAVWVEKRYKEKVRKGQRMVAH